MGREGGREIGRDVEREVVAWSETGVGGGRPILFERMLLNGVLPRRKVNSHFEAGRDHSSKGNAASSRSSSSSSTGSSTSSSSGSNRSSTSGSNSSRQYQ